MQMITKLTGRWLGALLLMACFVGTAQAQRTVTLTLNTASLSDTTAIDSDIQVRGCLEGCVDDFSDLPGGDIIAWGDTTTLRATNIGGDYWNVTFQVQEDTMMSFKYFSTQAEASGASIGGWEDGDNHVLDAGTGDTTLTAHFFEKGEDKPYDWRPFESKEDSVGVWFRVYMNTEAALNAGYDRESDSLVVGVRGDDFTMTGPLDWGITFPLTAEDDENESRPGYQLFSGVAYYPSSLVGSTQAYKFLFEDAGETVGWEADVNEDPGTENREFTIPASDTTLYWKYWNNSAPASGAEQVTSTLIFAVDTTPLESIGIYDRGRGDSLEVRGEFNGWGCANPTICQMQRVPGEDVFEGAFPITAFAETNFAYKYFINFNDENFMTAFDDTPPNGWEEPISTTGANRSFAFEGADEQDIGLQFFNDVYPGNIIPEGVSIDVTFQVRMDSAIADMAAPFDPGSDSVTVSFTGDAIWAFTQDVQRDGDGNFQVDTGKIVLADDDQDGLYTGTMTIVGPTYAAIQYKYAFGGAGTFTEETGGSFNDAGRRRTRYIAANADGSWPTEWTFEEEVYLPSGLLPFEQNPAVGVSVEPIDGELPTKIALEANYPNPFNPSTTIEYSINAAEQVSLKVFDMTGRLVTTLVDGMQPASTYRVTFDADNLASGVYLYRLEAASTTITKKMILIK